MPSIVTRLSCLLYLAIAAYATAAEPASEFARVDRTADGAPRALQLAIVSYAPADRRDFSVDLISAVHIGDREYYRDLNERFRGYDALLYELVVPDEVGPDAGMSADHGMLSRLQIGMKDLLGLAFQLDEIDYSASNFVHADMSASMLKASMQERGESLYVYFWRVWYAAIEDYARDPLGLRELQAMSGLLGDRGDESLKVALAYEMVRATREGDFLGDHRGSALISARNEHAVGVLREQIDAGVRRIGLFYGAAHMADLEVRLLGELGLERRRVEWADAWRLESQPTGDTEPNTR